MAEFEDLKFIQLTSPDQFCLIPPYLFEQIKDSDMKLERLYQFGPALLSDPLVFLYVLAEKQTAKIKGVLWCQVNPFTEQLVVNVLSIDKEYQHNSALAKTIDFVRQLQKTNELAEKIQLITTRPEAYERALEKAGIDIQRTKKFIMEI